ncbi:MAG: glycosyltransferase [Planctomycetia bacterium]
MTRLLAIATAFVVPENRVVFKALADDFGFDVTLVSPNTWIQHRYGSEQRFTVEPEVRPGYRLVPLRFTAGRFDRYHSLMPELVRARPRIVVCAQEFNSFAAVHSLILARVAACNPLTVSCSLQNIPYAPSRFRHRLREWAGLMMSDVILASCNDAAALLKSRGYRGRTEILYPLGAASVSPPPPGEPRTRGAPFTVGFVGRIAAEKGVFTLAEACAQLGGDVRLLLVGDGPDRSQLENRLAQLGIAGRTTFVGLVSRDKVPEYYARMDALAMPSLSTPTWKEQFGVVLAEAMLMGLPIVGSTSGAIPEVIGDAGLLFPEGDAKALAEKLRTLKDDPDNWRNLSVRARARAETYFTPRAMATQLVNLFADLGAIGEKV